MMKRKQIRKGMSKNYTIFNRKKCKGSRNDEGREREIAGGGETRRPHF